MTSSKQVSLLMPKDVSSRSREGGGRTKKLKKFKNGKEADMEAYAIVYPPLTLNKVLHCGSILPSFK